MKYKMWSSLRPRDRICYKQHEKKNKIGNPHTRVRTLGTLGAHFARAALFIWCVQFIGEMFMPHSDSTQAHATRPLAGEAAPGSRRRRTSWIYRLRALGKNSKVPTECERRLS